MRVTGEHWKTFIDFAEKNPELITNQFRGKNGNANITKQWQLITNQLNSLGYGEKSVGEWRKAVTGWKCKTKAKAAKIKNEQSKTGGGECCVAPLNKLEEQLLNIMGKRALEGDEGVLEMGLQKEICGRNVAPEDVFQEISISTEPSSCSTTYHDHAYLNFENSSKITLAPIKRHEDFKENVSKKKKKILQSKELIQISQDSVTILQKMDKSLERLADSSEKMCNLLCRYFNEK